jgi:hypothetical protein
MANQQSHQLHTLVQREVQEYRNSLVWTPLTIAATLAFVMLLSVLFANRISAMGDVIMRVIMEDHAVHEVNITINVDEEERSVQRSYRIEREEGLSDEREWDFSRGWTFKPDTGSTEVEVVAGSAGNEDEVAGSLNPLLNMVHNFMLMVLLLVSANYLLGCLFNDRRDRSILFWKSMPVSEWQEVACKFMVAMLVAPAIFIAASALAQVASALLAMLLVWRMDKDPFELVLGHIQFGSLLFNQVTGWLLTALWLAPVYAWLLLASAVARRSPFMVAVAPVIGLFVLERLFLGTEYVGAAVASHLPHGNGGGSGVGFYMHGPDWASQDLAGLGLGLLFAAAALWVTVYLRRYRFEL